MKFSPKCRTSEIEIDIHTILGSFCNVFNWEGADIRPKSGLGKINMTFVNHRPRLNCKAKIICVDYCKNMPQNTKNRYRDQTSSPFFYLLISQLVSVLQPVILLPFLGYSLFLLNLGINPQKILRWGKNSP